MTRGRPKGSKNKTENKTVSSKLNKLCLKCTKECKQFAFITILKCHYNAKKATSKPSDNSTIESST
jgi:hypothetical protein